MPATEEEEASQSPLSVLTAFYRQAIAEGRDPDYMGFALPTDEYVDSQLSRCACTDCEYAFTPLQVARWRTRYSFSQTDNLADRANLNDRLADIAAAIAEFRQELQGRWARERAEEEEQSRIFREEALRNEQLYRERREREREEARQRSLRTCSLCYSITPEELILRGSWRVCGPCMIRVAQCPQCSRWNMRRDLTALERYNTSACRDCIRVDYRQCSCGIHYDVATDDPCCEPQEPEHCDCGDCGDCDSQESDDNTIFNYSYTPQLNFHGKDANRLFLGVELELAMKRDRYDMARLAYSLFGDLIYIKEDGSISYGWEMVTHPMSFAHAMSVDWEENLSALTDAQIFADGSTGMHVHVSKRGFSGPDHDYRWLMFWHRNARQLKVMARRDPSQWGSFDPYTRQNALSIAKKKDTNRNRYSAINSVPPNTYEVRIFAASTDPAQVRGSIALVASTVEYTRQLRASDILRRKGWEWGAFIEWLEQPAQERFAPALAEWNRLKPAETAIPARKPPRKRAARTTAPTVNLLEWEVDLIRARSDDSMF